MNHIQTIEKVTPKAAPVRYSTVARLSSLPFLVLASLASAQEMTAAAATTQLGDSAKAGMAGLVGAVVLLLLIGIGIRALWFGNAQVKKGITKSS